MEPRKQHILNISSCHILPLKIPILGGCCHICTCGCKALGILSCARFFLSIPCPPLDTSVTRVDESHLGHRTACWLVVETWIGAESFASSLEETCSCQLFFGKKMQRTVLLLCKNLVVRPTYMIWNASCFFVNIIVTICKEVNKKTYPQTTEGACAKADGPAPGWIPKAWDPLRMDRHHESYNYIAAFQITCRRNPTHFFLL